jgi:transglutaminase-like putative cysteine protease
MLYSIRHSTIYDYDHDVSLSHHLVRLKPRELEHQRSRGHSVESVPPATTRSEHIDHFGNTTGFLTIEGAHRRLEIHSRGVIEILPPVTSPIPGKTDPWEFLRDACAGGGMEAPLEPMEFVFASPLLPRRVDFAKYAQPSFTNGRPVLEAALDLCARIHADFAFDPRATTVMTSVLEFFRTRRGVCQDFAHLMVACLRSIGLPARYVSGYLETIPPPGKEKLIGADASHAWISVWCGKDGWRDLDPTNNLMPSQRHISVAWGRDFGDVSPVHGVLVGSGSHKLKVSVDVRPEAGSVISNQ